MLDLLLRRATRGRSDVRALRVVEARHHAPGHAAHLVVADGEDARERRAAEGREPLHDGVEARRLVEGLEEALGLAPRAAEVQRLGADDEPADEREDHEEDEHRLHGDRRLQDEGHRIELRRGLGGRGTTAVGEEGGKQHRLHERGSTPERAGKSTVVAGGLFC